MYRFSALLLALAWLVPTAALAQHEKVASAESAGPSSLSERATIVNWDMTVLREGSNGWTCLPDNADTPGEDPWCVNDPWRDFLHAYMQKEDPSYDKVGIAYMLQGDTPVSNTDPFATEKTNDADWVEDLGAHLMVILPNHSDFSNISTDPNNGGPWIMWPNTPYAHIMIPIEGAPK